MNTLALRICLAVHAAGGTAYFTGGLVRDLLLERDSSDYDIEVFGLTREALEKILSDLCGRVDFVGASYGVYKADGLDIGFPRRDKTHGKDAIIEIDPFMSIHDAALRRDLTINAMYFNPITMKLHDPHNGRQSLFNQMLRATSEKTYNLDPLRPVRTARFHATLGFDVDYNTLVLCRAADVDAIQRLPRERVMGELTKALMEAAKPSMFFHMLHTMKLLKPLFPEIEATMFIEQGMAYHPEGSVYNHTMLAIDAIPVEERELSVMLALLFHDLGKSLVPNEVDGDRIHFKGHAEELSLAIVALDRLTTNGALTSQALDLIRFHMRPYDFKDGKLSNKTVRRLASKIDIPKLMKVHKADRLGRGEEAVKKYEAGNLATVNAIMEVYEQIKNEIKPLVLGRHLIAAGWTPGDHFGEILRELYDRQLDEQFSTVEEGVKMAHTLFGNRKKG